MDHWIDGGICGLVDMDQSVNGSMLGLMRVWIDG